METEVPQDDVKHRGKYWLITLVSLAAAVGLLLYYPAFCWVPLPFFLTFFVRAIGMM